MARTRMFNVPGYECRQTRIRRTLCLNFQPQFRRKTRKRRQNTFDESGNGSGSGDCWEIGGCKKSVNGTVANPHFLPFLNSTSPCKSRVQIFQKVDLRRGLDIRQRKVLELFEEFETVTSSQIGKLFGFKPRTNSQICKKWCEEKFLEVADNSNRARKYRLAKRYWE